MESVLNRLRYARQSPTYFVSPSVIIIMLVGVVETLYTTIHFVLAVVVCSISIEPISQSFGP